MARNNSVWILTRKENDYDTGDPDLIAAFVGDKAQGEAEAALAVFEATNPPRGMKNDNERRFIFDLHEVPIGLTINGHRVEIMLAPVADDESEGSVIIRRPAI